MLILIRYLHLTMSEKFVFNGTINMSNNTNVTINEPKNLILCAGVCGKHYSPRTLEKNHGICGFCVHKARTCPEREKFKPVLEKLNRSIKSKETCSRCSSTRMMEVSSKCNDRCDVRLDGEDLDGYPPSNLNIGGGDYVAFKVCADCGQMAGSWPLPLDVMNYE